MKTCRRKWFVQWVAAFVSIVLFGTYLGSLSMNTLTVSAICCRKDGFDKSRYTLTGNVAQDVATIAKSQAGRTCSDFGYSGVDYGAWCDEYVADCLENAGCDDSIVAHGGTVADFEKKMRKRGAVVVSSPQPGDLLFFSWSHVEIVTRVEGGTVYCAGGNNQGKTYPGGRCAGERNAQSVAKSMGGSIRLYLRPNYKGVNPNPPTNISIQADRTTITAGESITFTYTIENSTDSCIGIDKDGSRFDTIGVSGTSGTVSYTFSQPGVYCVITAGSNPYGSACCDGVWIKVNEKTAPFNISIQADKTTIIAGESVSFSYTIENSTDSCIGIDKDGSRFDTIGVSGTSGTVSYTFSQPGVYCVITAGSNPYGSACCDGVWIKVNEKTAPFNISIQADRTEIVMGESITFTYTIENSTDSCIGIDKDGSRFDTVNVSGTSGSISYTFSQPGVYCVITAGSNPYGAACCDGVWIKVKDRKSVV